MQLSTMLLTDLLEAFRDMPRSAAELRAAPRTALSVKVEVTLLDAGDISGVTYTAVTRNISTSGIGMFQSRSVERNQRVLITLQRPDRAMTVTMRCVVMHCCEMAQGIFAVGAQLEDVLGDGQSSAPKSNPKSGRKTPNSSCR